MLQRHHGVIAGIASVAGYRGLAGAKAYGAAKAAQINLLESLRVHIARTGVHVTTICPGFVRTDRTSGNPSRCPSSSMPGLEDAHQLAGHDRMSDLSAAADPGPSVRSVQN